MIWGILGKWEDDEEEDSNDEDEWGYSGVEAREIEGHAIPEYWSWRSRFWWEY